MTEEESEFNQGVQSAIKDFVDWGWLEILNHKDGQVRYRFTEKGKKEGKLVLQQLDSSSE